MNMAAEARPGEWESALRPDQGPKAPDRIHFLLEEKLVTLALAPEAVIRPRALAQVMGMTRDDLRAPLARLARDGMLRRLPDGSMRVTEIDTDAQLRLLEVRRRLESLAAGLAAERACPEQRARFRALDRSFRQVASHSDDIVFLRLDRAFNQLLVDAAHNAYCSAMMAVIESQARRYFFRNRAALDVARTAALHADIAAAVAQGAPARAEEAVQALLDYNERYARTQRRLS